MQFIVSKLENRYVKDTKLITREELELQFLAFKIFKLMYQRGKITYLIRLEMIIS